MDWICLKSCAFIVHADIVSAADTKMVASEFNRSPNALEGIDIEQEMSNNFAENYPHLVDFVDVKFSNVHTDSTIDPFYFERKVRIRYQPVIRANTPEAATYLNLVLND